MSAYQFIKQKLKGTEDPYPDRVIITEHQDKLIRSEFKTQQEYEYFMKNNEIYVATGTFKKEQE